MSASAALHANAREGAFAAVQQNSRLHARQSHAVYPPATYLATLHARAELWHQDQDRLVSHVLLRCQHPAVVHFHDLILLVQRAAALSDLCNISEMGRPLEGAWLNIAGPSRHLIAPAGIGACHVRICHARICQTRQLTSLVLILQADTSCVASSVLQTSVKTNAVRATVLCLIFALGGAAQKTDTDTCSAADTMVVGLEKATFAAGCFW